MTDVNLTDNLVLFVILLINKTIGKFMNLFFEGLTSDLMIL